MSRISTGRTTGLELLQCKILPVVAIFSTKGKVLI